MRAYMAAVRALWRWVYDRPYLLLALATLMWGGNAVASRLAVGHISPMALTWFRWVTVCLLIAPFLGKEVLAQTPALIARKSYFVVMAALGYVTFNGLMYAAAHHTAAINLTILQGSIPVMVLIGGLAWFGIRIGLVQALGVTVTLVGVAIVASRGNFSALAALSFNIGDVWMIAACAAYSVFVVLLRSRPDVPDLLFVAGLSGIALILTLPLVLWEIAAGTIQWPDGSGIATVLYVAVFPSLLSQLLFMRGVELIGASRAGIFVNLVPVFGALFAVAILGEPFRFYHALALGLVLSGIRLAEGNRARLSS
jgi:drug/metabolite transporter (DMT)-like permease